jgi:hypothetical protein
MNKKTQITTERNKKIDLEKQQQTIKKKCSSKNSSNVEVATRNYRRHDNLEKTTSQEERDITQQKTNG